MPRNHFFTLRNYFRMLIYGYCIGALAVFIFSLAARDSLSVRTVVGVAVIGFFINTTIWTFEYFVRNLTERLSMVLQFPLHIALTTSGGVIGFVVGRSLTSLMWTGRLPSLAVFKMPLIVTVIVSLFAGVSMYFYIVLEERLREKVREQELAQQELTLARAIQERLLPPPEYASDGFRVTARNLPAQFVAGDFYDLIARSGGGVIAVVADVAGKGVAASLIMASVKSVLPMIAVMEKTVEGTMRRLNEKLTRELGRREFVALACAAYEPSTHRLVLANAGLPDPYLIRDGVATPLVVGGPRFPLGIRASLDYESLTIDLREGDRLLLLTDGLPEASVGEEEPIGYVRLAELAAAHTSLEALFTAIERETTEPKNDDWTAVHLEVLSGVVRASGASS